MSMPIGSFGNDFGRLDNLLPCGRRECIPQSDRENIRECPVKRIRCCLVKDGTFSGFNTTQEPVHAVGMVVETRSVDPGYPQHIIRCGQ